jgi:hypothetical protein
MALESLQFRFTQNSPGEALAEPGKRLSMRPISTTSVPTP